MMRLILLIEDNQNTLLINKPRASVLELKGKNAVVIDLPVESKKPELRVKNLERFSFNDRQEKFLTALARKSVTNHEYRKFFKNQISTETARQDLAALVIQGLLVKKGTRKGTVYWVKESFLEK